MSQAGRMRKGKRAFKFVTGKLTGKGEIWTQNWWECGDDKGSWWGTSEFVAFT